MSAEEMGWSTTEQLPAASVDDRPGATDPVVLYLDLLERVLLRLGIAQQRYRRIVPSKPFRRRLLGLVEPLLNRFGLALTRVVDDEISLRREGRSWPVDAESMIGLARLRNIRECALDVLRRGVPGDFVEAGVWRGGATIYMRAILAAVGDKERSVWAYDSFSGLPKPDGRYRYTSDNSDTLWMAEVLRVSEDEVRANFARYGLLDGRTRFVKGWFKDTMPSTSPSAIALLRLDGDLYESIMDSLTALYPKLAVGGYVIVDDYFYIGQCRQAVDAYRQAHGVQDELRRVDWNACFWRKTAPSGLG